MKKKIGIGLLIAFIVMQFVRIDRENLHVESNEDFVVLTKATPEITELLRSSCYDCHSNEVVYPWYSQIAPISWFVGHHVEEGREHFNFSKWGTYDVEKQVHKLEECIEELEEHKMPLASYTWIHGDLSEEDREMLVNWLETL